jgi:5-methylcytosine-specific restriction protein A
MKTLAQGGSDRVQNAIALCPNCHRALHYASNAVELANRVYKRVTQLIPE